eukprot:TRINITY_DN8581_c0_g1_i1.p1 TRINITY_DN8581_c0_g1~~TRINITY_DN8581_c0_g1_i1.p1  ORF type:complete len:110 (+),score=14.34 TRINITY_DN8581_c0_g1_i1:204-533(+)
MLFLTVLDLRSFSNLTAIGDYFLLRCSSLTSLDLSSLNNLTTIGKFCLVDCVSISSLDLTSFNNVTEVGEGFLTECSSLTTVKGLRPESSVKRKVIEEGKILSGITFTL